jgi:hypothetical protein
MDSLSEFAEKAERQFSFQQLDCDDRHGAEFMSYLLIKAAVSAVLIVAVSELAKRSPSFGALVASLPLVSILGMIWLWRDTGDTARLAAHAEATFWYVLPSLPMFLALPILLRIGLPFWPALFVVIALTMGLYLIMVLVLARYGVEL